MSESVRTWLLRLLALSIAISLWFSVSFEDREVLSERAVEASVSYNRPRGFVVLDPVQNVTVRVRGSSKQVRQLNPYMVDVQVDLGKAAEGLATVNLGPENVLMPDGLEVVAIEPNLVRVELEREISQRIQVDPEVIGEAAPGSTASEPEVFPNQVLVIGPASLLSKTKRLRTRPVNLDGHGTTFEESVPVVSPDPLIKIMQPSKVSVRVQIERPRTPATPDDGAPEAQRDPS